MPFAIRQKKTGLYLAGKRNHKWVALEKARVFPSKSAITNFLNWNNVNYYLKDDGTDSLMDDKVPPIKGLGYFVGDKLKVETDFETVEIDINTMLKSK